jgi:hypothetical protein
MSTEPKRPGTEPEIDQETKTLYDERLKTIDRDAKDSEEWTPETKDRRIQQLKTFVPK